MSEAVVDLALDAQCDLGESPIWDDRVGVVYFVDINKKAVHAFTPSTGSHESLTLQEPAATVMLTDDPEMIIVPTKRDVLLIKFTKEDKRIVRVLTTTPAEHGVDDMRFNDGKVSPQGTLILGRMHLKWRDGNKGRLYALLPNSSELTEVLAPEEVWLPNGMDWTVKTDGSGGGTMYFACSGAETLTAYDTDKNGIVTRDELTGVVNSKIIANLSSEHKHVPDGLTLDSEDQLWVAPGESGTIIQVHSKTGEILQTISLPVKRPTACTFGGANLDELYVTTRVESGDGASPHHGGLYRVKIPGVKGKAAAYKFDLSRWLYWQKRNGDGEVVEGEENVADKELVGAY